MILSSTKIKVICLLKLITFFCAIMWASVNTTYAQKYYFDFYSVKEGLAQSKVYTILQDDLGYLWLGTESGVSMFDGNAFINYSAEDGLAEKGVKILYKDSKGNIWMGHKGGGITIYDGKEFIRHPLTYQINGDITSFLEGKDNELYITTWKDGLYILDQPLELDTAKLKYKQFKGRILSDLVFSSTKTDDDTIYLVTDLGIKKYDPGTENFIPYLPEGLTNYFQITSMLEDSQGNQWFGTYHGGLYKYNKETKEFKVYDARDGLAHNWISTLSEDSRGNVWVGTWGGGITKFDERGYKTFDPKNGLVDNKIYCILEDFEGNILIGTNEHGMGIFKGEDFITYNADDGLINQQVWAVYQDINGKYWFGTNMGISVFDPQKDKDQQFTHYNQSTNAIGDQIRYLVEDKDHNIWVGTNDNGVMEYDINRKRFIYNPLVNQYFSNNNSVTALDVDIDNQLWVGTLDGIIYYNINNRIHKRVSQLDGLSGNDINSIYADSKGRVWVGVREKGVNVILKDGIKQINIEGSVTPNCFVEDTEGNIWIGTSTKGIFITDGESIIDTLRQSDGLLSDFITQLDTDNDNNIYIGTNHGLNKIGEDNNIYTYTERSGFTGIEAKPNASFKDQDGNMWFGTVNGVTKYQPEYDTYKEIQPLTHIARLRVNLVERPMKEDQVFNYYENSIIFDYNSICLSNPDAVQFQIMLEGTDKDWRPVTKQTMVNYSSLQPGKYVFKVKARNSAGIWNEEPVQYSFTIKPPFYKTWYFIFSVAILISFLIILYIKVREKNLIKEKKILEEKVAERTAELAQKNKDIMDSIRYAQRIQIAILPPDIPFEDTFVLFKPKDIVSGDFYWFESKDGIDMLAAVDCTGHGVPGAFLSILGHNMLTKIVTEYGITDPGKILQKLNDEVLFALHQQDVADKGIVNDGMDLALICVDKKNNKLDFAGAYNPLFFIREGELTEIKADRFPIGRSISDKKKEFTTHSMKVQKGDSFYIFSDGYADQFGGPDNKKFRKKNMKDLLLKIQNMKMADQSTTLEEEFNTWKGNNEQVDDIVIIGKRI